MPISGYKVGDRVLTPAGREATVVRMVTPLTVVVRYANGAEKRFRCAALRNDSQDEAPNAGAEGQGRAMFVVIENTPGYLPEDDDPATFDDHKSACEYMRERVEDYVDSVMEGYDWRGPMPDVAWFETGAGAYVTDRQREHDLGRYIYVTEDES